MVTTIVKWGNSQGIRLPKVLLENVNMVENDVVEVLSENDTIIIKKSKKEPKKYQSIQELFAEYNGEYQTIEMNWGEPQGEEVW